MSTNEEFCIKNEEFCTKNDESCIENDELCIYNDEFCKDYYAEDLYRELNSQTPLYFVGAQMASSDFMMSSELASRYVHVHVHVLYTNNRHHNVIGQVE